MKRIIAHARGAAVARRSPKPQAVVRTLAGVPRSSQSRLRAVLSLAGGIVTHIRKAALVCNRCGAPQKIDPTVDDPFSSSLAQRESAWAGWLKADAGHHLCPPCAEEYSRRKAEMGAEPKRPAGIETASFGL